MTENMTYCDKHVSSRKCLFFVVCTCFQIAPPKKCSHLTPKSINSYIDDLVIANCLIDARVFVHALPHVLFAILLCELVDCIVFSIQGHPFVVSLVWFFFWPNGWTRMPKYSL